jgi:hypothetical protein
MKLLYSKSNVPYIETENGDKIIFSTTTESEKGFKWVAISGFSTTTLPLSAGGRGKKKTFTIKEPVTFIVDVGLHQLTKKAAKEMSTPYTTINSLKRIMGPLVTSNGYFPRTNLDKLEKALLTINDIVDDEDYLDEDPMGYYEDDGEDE